MVWHTFSVLPEQHARVALAFAPIVANLSATAPAPTSLAIITTVAHAVKWYGSSLPCSRNFSRLIGAARTPLVCSRFIMQERHLHLELCFSQPSMRRLLCRSRHRPQQLRRLRKDLSFRKVREWCVLVPRLQRQSVWKFPGLRNWVFLLHYRRRHRILCT